MNKALREDLCMAESLFRRACEQVFVLNKDIEKLTIRFDDAEAMGNKALRYHLRLRISVMEGVRNMYYEFAALKATVITELQHHVLAFDAHNDSSSDSDFLSELVYGSSVQDVDADDSFEFCWRYHF